MRRQHFFSSSVQFARCMLDALSSVGMRKAARDLVHDRTNAPLAAPTRAVASTIRFIRATRISGVDFGGLLFVRHQSRLNRSVRRRRIVPFQFCRRRTLLPMLERLACMFTKFPCQLESFQDSHEQISLIAKRYIH